MIFTGIGFYIPSFLDINKKPQMLNQNLRKTFTERVQLSENPINLTSKRYQRKIIIRMDDTLDVFIDNIDLPLDMLEDNLKMMLGKYNKKNEVLIVVDKYLKNKKNHLKKLVKIVKDAGFKNVCTSFL